MKTIEFRNHSSLQALLLFAFLNMALLNAQENVTVESEKVVGIGPYSDFTPNQRLEAGLVAAVDTGELTTAQTWTYSLKEAGNYQLGMAWIEVLGPGQDLQYPLVSGPLFLVVG